MGDRDGVGGGGERESRKGVKKEGEKKKAGRRGRE